LPQSATTPWGDIKKRGETTTGTLMVSTTADTD
jgi:hypothetical protein